MVITVNVPVEDPIGMVMLADESDAAVAPAVIERLTVVATTADAPRVTVPVELARPPATDVGLRASEPSGLTVRLADRLSEPIVTVIVAVVAVATAAGASTVKVAVVTPPATTSGDVTTADGELLAILTETPPTGVADTNVIVPVDCSAAPPAPPITAVGLSANDAIGFVIVNVAVALTPSRVAVTVGVTFAATPRVTIGNVTVVAPAGTVTGEIAARFVTFGFGHETATAMPPAGAGPPIVIVPVALAKPPITEAGAIVRLVNSGVSVRVVVAVAPFGSVAVIVTGVLAATSEVVTVKVPVVAPAATSTGEPTIVASAAFAPVVATVTETPPAGAAALRVTVPVTVVVEEPATLVGATATDFSCGLTTRVLDIGVA